MCVVSNHPEEFLRVFYQKGHAVVQFLQIVFQVTGGHLEEWKGQKRRSQNNRYFLIPKGQKDFFSHFW